MAEVSGSIPDGPTTIAGHGGLATSHRAFFLAAGRHGGRTPPPAAACPCTTGPLRGIIAGNSKASESWRRKAMMRTSNLTARGCREGRGWCERLDQREAKTPSERQTQRPRQDGPSRVARVAPLEAQELVLRHLKLGWDHGAQPVPLRGGFFVFRGPVRREGAGAGYI